MSWSPWRAETSRVTPSCAAVGEGARDRYCGRNGRERPAGTATGGPGRRGGLPGRFRGGRSKSKIDSGPPPRSPGAPRRVLAPASLRTGPSTPHLPRQVLHQPRRVPHDPHGVLRARRPSPLGASRSSHLRRHSGALVEGGEGTDGGPSPGLPGGGAAGRTGGYSRTPSETCRLACRRRGPGQGRDGRRPLDAPPCTGRRTRPRRPAAPAPPVPRGPPEGGSERELLSAPRDFREGSEKGAH